MAQELEDLDDPEAEAGSGEDQVLVLIRTFLRRANLSELSCLDPGHQLEMSMRKKKQSRAMILVCPREEMSMNKTKSVQICEARQFFGPRGAKPVKRPALAAHGRQEPKPRRKPALRRSSSPLTQEKQHPKGPLEKKGQGKVKVFSEVRD